MPKKQGQFNALIEGDKDRREVSRNFQAGERPNVILGTAEGAVRVMAWEEDGKVHVEVVRGFWSLGSGEPMGGPPNGQAVLLYSGPISGLVADNYEPLIKPVSGEG